MLKKIAASLKYVSYNDAFINTITKIDFNRERVMILSSK